MFVLGNLRKLGDVPSAAQRFDEKHAGSHSARQEIDSGALVAQGGALRRNDLKISHQSALVTGGGKSQ